VIPSGFIARWFVAVGMCCLTVLGAAPRLDCLCPDLACQSACEQPLAGILGEGAVECDQQPACCCHHEERSPQPDNGPACHNSGCHCEMQVVQDERTLAVRNDGKLPPPSVLWLASDTLTSELTDPELRLDRSLFTGLPPDDPVSRAQILRI